MKLDPTVKIILIVFVVIVALVVLYFIFKPSVQQPAAPPVYGTVPPATASPNIVDILGGLFSGIKNLFGGGMGPVGCDPRNPGYDNTGHYTIACGGTSGGGGANCDPNRPGYDMNGFLNSQCGGGG